MYAYISFISLIRTPQLVSLYMFQEVQELACLTLKLLTIDIIEDGKILAVMCETRMDGWKSKHMPLSQFMACCTMNLSGLQTAADYASFYSLEVEYACNKPAHSKRHLICSESFIKLIVPKTKPVPRSA